MTLKGYQGAIEIAKQENLRTDNCQWTIVAPKSSKINITFTSFKIIYSRFKSLNILSPFGQDQCNKSILIVSTDILC